MRALLVLEGFGRSRCAGDKYEVALLEAVKFVKTEAPNMPISTAEVKRVLKEFYPEEGRGGPSNMEIVRNEHTWTFRATQSETDLPSGEVPKRDKRRS